ncbi:MAG TPA: hypothetical protein VEM96_01055 [Pyrinomonadaceae bacterium]|nr:hypothetical protein [Pyrinomonadaceae bacterium]
MTSKEPSKKDAKQGKQGAQSFQEPPTQQSQQTDDQYSEEAGVHSFSEPSTEQGFREEAEAPESQTAFLGVDENLLQIKREIENQLLQGVSQQKASTHAEDAFQGAGNIVGVGLGTSMTPTVGPGGEVISSGGEPGKPALNVYVVDRTSLDEVKSVVVDSMGVSAASGDDVPMNVIVTGLIEARPHTFRIRPAPGGVSVGHFRITAGTIGCLCVGRTAPRNSRLMILSNNHVLANSNGGAFGDCVTQPGPYDGGRCPADQVAILERFVPINFTGGVNYVDCATAWCWPDRVRRELIYLVNGQRRFFRIGSQPINPVINCPVGKTGRTTQLTRGTVIDTSATIRVNYGGGRVALFADQISIRGAGGTNFSAGGDSGSSIWVWDSSLRPMGLLFAGGGGITFGNKMTRVVAALDINLYT